MKVMSKRPSCTAKPHLRLSTEAKQTLQAAAAAVHRSVSDFVLESALDKAEKTLADRTPAGWKAFQETLEATSRSHPRFERPLQEPSLFERVVPSERCIMEREAKPWPCRRDFRPRARPTQSIPDPFCFDQSAVRFIADLCGRTTGKPCSVITPVAHEEEAELFGKRLTRHPIPILLARLGSSKTRQGQSVAVHTVG